MWRADALFALAVAMAVVLSASPAASYNITRILEDHHYLTATRLATEIKHHHNVTVLAVDNADMSDTFAKHLSLLTLRNVLSLHILTAAARSSTSSPKAPRSPPLCSNTMASIVKAVKELPYSLAIIQMQHYLVIS